MWDLCLIQPLMSFVSLGKSFSCSVLQFTHLSNCQLVFDGLPIMLENEIALQILGAYHMFVKGSSRYRVL